VLFFAVGLTSPRASADILAAGFFTGNIDRFDEQTAAQSTFASIAGNPGLAGMVYNPTDRRVYVSALNHGGIYVLDANTGSTLAFHSLGYGPGGVGVDNSGNVYVTDFTSDLVRVYQPSSFTTPINSISVAAAVSSGVGVLSNGHVLIATAGGGVFRYDGFGVSTFSPSPTAIIASSQIAVDSSDNVYIGHALGFANFVLKFNASGAFLGVLEVTDAMVSGTGQGSSVGTSPSGVAVDADGNVIVAALGRSNPGDPGGERGGVFKFNPNGILLETIATASSAYSSVAIVPTPQIVDSFLVHNGWSGGGSSEDAGKSVHLETGSPQPLEFENLINTSKGINGIGFRVRNFENPAGLNASDFEFQMSPQGAFVPGDNPPAGWTAAPAPSSIDVNLGSPDEVLLAWPDNQIENRWLRITVKSTTNTGLLAPLVYYVGHLRGETSGDGEGIYTVSFQDIQQIRNAVGSVVGSDSIYDIDKSGTVSFADISAMRSAVGSQLPKISVP